MQNLGFTHNMQNLRFIINLTSSTLGPNGVGGAEVSGRAVPPWGTTHLFADHLQTASLMPDSLTLRGVGYIVYISFSQCIVSNLLNRADNSNNLSLSKNLNQSSTALYYVYFRLIWTFLNSSFIPYVNLTRFLVTSVKHKASFTTLLWPFSITTFRFSPLLFKY